jgi:hypothetical protein
MALVLSVVGVSHDVFTEPSIVRRAQRPVIGVRNREFRAGSQAAQEPQSKLPRHKWNWRNCLLRSKIALVGQL